LRGLIFLDRSEGGRGGGGERRVCEREKEEDATSEGGRERERERKTHSSYESTSTTLIHSERHSLEDRLLRLRIAKRDVLERDEVSGRSKFGWLT